MQKNIPLKIIFYLINEFSKSLFIIFLVFLALSLLINFVEELTYFKEQKVNNLFLFISYLTLIKTPNTLMELLIFIFLFTGILFFVKIKKNNEINTILLSGISKLLPILTSAIFSFTFGIIIIATFAPISSELLKIYERSKRIYASNENLIVINNSGLWFLENLPNSHNIIRADTIIDNNFSKLNNLTIYNLDKDFNFIKRIDSVIAEVNKKNWNLKEAKIFSENLDINKKENNFYKNINFVSTIEINDLKEYFSNANTTSFWEINSKIQDLNNRGYSGDELKIKLHKYLSLPFYLFGMILLSTVFTIGSNNEYNTFMYYFFGIAAGFLIYFLNDLSIALGLSNKLPLEMSVWTPIVIILLLSILNLIKINEK